MGQQLICGTTDSTGSTRVPVLVDSAGKLITAQGPWVATVSDGLANAVGAYGVGGIAYLQLMAMMAYNGATFDKVRVASSPWFFNIAAVAITAGTPSSLWTATAGKKFRMLGFCVGVSVAAASVIFKETATEFLRTPILPINGSISSPPMGNGWLAGSVSTILKIDVSANATVSGFVYGVEES